MTSSAARERLSEAGRQRRAFLKSAGQAAGAFAATIATTGAAAERGNDSPVVLTKHGRVRGFIDRGVLVFKGIPYGSNTASRRFKPPLPPAAWNDVRPALEYGPSAPQERSPDAMSEDCLRLNVWTRGLIGGQRRAVMVYFHGGGFSSGSGSSPLYSGVNLCRRGDVVVVTVNHRLNVFGYAFLEKALGAKFAGGGNAGQLDLILALEWVRDNIAAFGGDPTRITIFGHSGGGAKIATLMAMPSASGLFHRAITMSGQQVTAAGPNASAERGRILLDALGIARSGDDALARIPVEKILAASRTRDPFLASGDLFFGPVVDATSLPRHPFYPDAPRQSAQIPLLLGNAHDETRNLIGGSHPEYFDLSWGGLGSRIERELRGRSDIDGELVVAEYRRMYPSYTPSQVFFAATTAGRSWRGQVIEAELRAAEASPTWVYQVDFPSPKDGGKWGAPHGIDIPLAFDNTHEPEAITGNSDRASRMAAIVSETFIAFAKTGEPQNPAIPQWPRYRKDSRATLIFDLPSGVINDPRGGERRLFARVPYVQPGT